LQQQKPEQKLILLIHISLMKKTVLSLLFSAALTVTAFAQQVYTYRFSSAPFTSSPLGGPTLQPIGTLTPRTVTMPATTCPTMPVIPLRHFAANAGFRAPAFFTDTYSIEMLFKFDDLGGYNRIIDFSNSNSDNGIYTYGDCLNFYPSGNIGTCPGAFDTINYKYLAITRNGANQEMNVYFNGVLLTTYTDALDYYVIGSAPNDSIKFFRDDRIVPNEASSGNVAMIRMANYVFSPAVVATNFSTFCASLVGLPEEQPLAGVSVYPNPAAGSFQVELGQSQPDGYRLELINAVGSVVWRGTGKSATSRTIDVTGLADGMYFLKIQSGGIFRTQPVFIYGNK
jgi:hypothetical protein